ncbi:MAG: nuclease [Candidatus Duberdicusella sinuisediminis]|nr:MAG: nuclease [Candidatus Omnitrophota bacterium]
MKVKKFLLFLFLFFLSCSQPPDYSHIKIIKVIDGDTLVLEDRSHLRLIGIDTPELRKKTFKGFVYEPAPLAEEAKEFTRKLAEGKYARIEFDVDKRDKYGRLLGYCFIKEKEKELFLNKRLLEEGFSVLYTYPPNVKYIEEFVKAQREARQSKKGLWGAYQVIKPEEAKNFIGQIRTIRGRVLSTYNSGKAIFLNFGKDYKKDFTAVIFRNSFNYFYQKGITPEVFYRGKVVEVTGRIREYNGPEIIVNSPLEIEVIE